MKNLKAYLIGTGILFIVIVVVAIYFYQTGKNKYDKSVDLPEQTDWGKTLTTDEANEIKRHAAALYKDMKGLNLMPRKPEVYNDYLASSDRIFVGTANYFVKNYGEGETLAQWIKSENYTATNLNQLTATIDAILARLAKHGIL